MLMDAQPLPLSATVFHSLSRLAWWTAFFTVVYNFCEGVFALWAGHIGSSWGVISFGIDAVAESLSGGVILWRFAPGIRADERERFAQRERRAVVLIGLSFLVLSMVVFVEAIQRLLGHVHAEEHGLAFIVAGVSLVVKPLLFGMKWYLGQRLQSEALRADAKQTLACAGLSAALLLGLGMNQWFGVWQADSVLALLIAAVLVREGFHALRHRHILCCPISQR